MTPKQFNWSQLQVTDISQSDNTLQAAALTSECTPPKVLPEAVIVADYKLKDDLQDDLNHDLIDNLNDYLKVNLNNDHNNDLNNDLGGQRDTDGPIHNHCGDLRSQNTDYSNP